MHKFKEKRFRYGAFSTVMMLLAIVLFVFVNLVADEFNISQDLTQEQIFSLTRQSHEFLANLEEDVTLYYIIPTGHEHTIIAQLLEEYAAASPHINVETRDPLLNPTIVHQFASDAGFDGGIPIGQTGSIVVQSRTGTRIVTEHDMMPRDFWGNLQNLGFEAEITRAIHHVTQGEPPIVYFVYGSGELPVQPGLVNFLESENFITHEINLVTTTLPQDADILFIQMPARDWTPDKANNIEAFLQEGGSAFIALNFTVDPTPNMNRVLAGYGLNLGDYLVLEGDSRQVFMNLPYYILPTSAGHEIVTDLEERNFANLLLFPSAIETLEMRRSSTEITPIWRTSANAFGRTDQGEESLSRVSSDIDGPFDLAVAVRERDALFADREFATHMVVVGNLSVIDDGVNTFIGGGNWHFVLNSLRWLQGQPPGIFIPNRTPPGMEPMLIPDFTANIFRGIAMGGIPLLCLGIGLIVWFRRRYS